MGRTKRQNRKVRVQIQTLCINCSTTYHTIHCTMIDTKRSDSIFCMKLADASLLMPFVMLMIEEIKKEEEENDVIEYTAVSCGKQF